MSIKPAAKANAHIARTKLKRVAKPMSILGVVVRMQPKYLPQVLLRASAEPGVEVALNPGDGRLVMVIEDTLVNGQWHTASAAMADIATWPEVMNTSLVYEYSGPDVPGAEVAAVGAFGHWRNGPASDRPQPPS
jgi:periplasmic nitrate reductase NapD